MMLYAFPVCVTATVAMVVLMNIWPVRVRAPNWVQITVPILLIVSLLALAVTLWSVP